jgi:hypothetical protein
MLIGDKKENNYNCFYRETNDNTKNKKSKNSSPKKKSPKKNLRVDPNIDYTLNMMIIDYSNNNINKKNNSKIDKQIT